LDWIDHTNHTGFFGAREAVRILMRGLHTALLDFKVDITHCVCTSDAMATNKVICGSQDDELFGQPASNQVVEFRVMNFILVQDGKLIEHWAYLNHYRSHPSKTLPTVSDLASHRQV